MSNRTTMAQLREMTADQVSILAVDQLAMLLEDVADLKADAKRLDDLLTTGLALAYGPRAAELRKAEGKATGTVSIEAEGFTIRADSPKKVEWSQAELRVAMKTVKGWGADPADDITAALSVPESKFNAWPASIRAVFEPARTVSTGRASFKIERSKRRAA